MRLGELSDDVCNRLDSDITMKVTMLQISNVISSLSGRVYCGSGSEFRTIISCVRFPRRAHGFRYICYVSVEFEILRRVAAMSAVFWTVTPCKLVKFSICMELGTYIIPPEPISAAYFIDPISL
jgi:hypothetical protein